MSDIETLTRRIGDAKAFLDAGMCKVGPKFDKSSPDQAMLAGSSSRALALADAVLQLCLRDHPNEALPLLRQLAQTAVTMRWIAANPARGAQAAQALKEAREGGWAALFDDTALEALAKEAELPGSDLKAVLKTLPSFAAGNRKGAPWSHVFSENLEEGAEAASVLRLCVQMMGHVLKALDTRWPEAFPEWREIWQ